MSVDQFIHPILKPYLSSPRTSALYNAVSRRYVEVAIPAHGWDHIYRCLINAVTIGETEDCRMEIVVPAMLLHDIGFIYNPDPLQHHLLGAEKSYEWTGAWTQSERDDIAGCIRKHKGNEREFRTLPETVEQKIVCDADLLEKVGYIGIVQGIRTYVEFGESCWPEYRSLYKIVDQLKDYADVQFYTSKGRAIAETRGSVEIRKDIYNRAEMEMRFYYRDNHV